LDNIIYYILFKEKFEGIDKSLHIDGIEMIGGLVRTPVIEKCITQICGNNWMIYVFHMIFLEQKNIL